MSMRTHQLSRVLLAVVAALALAGSMRAADPDPKLIAKAQRFLEDETRAKAILGFAHFGATYRGVECLNWSDVDQQKQLPAGHFTITVRYDWAGLLSADEHTNLVYFFNERGRFYKFRDDETTSLFKPFELSKAIVDLTKEAIRASVKDSKDEEMKANVEAAIRAVDVKALLRLKLMVEQP
jgi:hypothetical protein